MVIIPCTAGPTVGGMGIHVLEQSSWSLLETLSDIIPMGGGSGCAPGDE